jgi:RNA binding exosome subunit
MHISHHADQRMNQRGISRRLVEFALRHGRIEGNKHILDRNESRKLIAALTEELRLAKRALDKGGVTVVEGDDTVITTYNLQSTPAKRSHSHSHGAPSHV